MQLAVEFASARGVRQESVEGGDLRQFTGGSFVLLAVGAVLTGCGSEARPSEARPCVVCSRWLWRSATAPN
jgi:hypothetical protein